MSTRTKDKASNSPSTNDKFNVAGITNGVAYQLKKSKPWIFALSIAAFIISLASLISLISSFSMIQFSILLMLVSLISTVLYFVVAYFLFKYARSINTVLQSGLSKDLEHALAFQTKIWMTLGALLLTFVVIMLISVFGLL